MPKPLVVLLNGSSESASVWRPPLLLPYGIDLEEDSVSSVDEAIEKIHNHYSSGDNFVGGMGESDLGVILAAPSSDILDLSESAISLMEQVKAERHGVPFYLATTGIPGDAVDWETWGGSGGKLVEAWLVSLYAASPPYYKAETGGDASPAAFGQVCQFLIEAAEHGMAVEATVAPSRAAAGRELALSLGARQVHTQTK